MFEFPYLNNFGFPLALEAADLVPFPLWSILFGESSWFKRLFYSSFEVSSPLAAGFSYLNSYGFPLATEDEDLVPLPLWSILFGESSWFKRLFYSSSEVEFSSSLVDGFSYLNNFGFPLALEDALLVPLPLWSILLGESS